MNTKKTKLLKLLAVAFWIAGSIVGQVSISQDLFFLFAAACGCMALAATLDGDIWLGAVFPMIIAVIGAVGIVATDAATGPAALIALLAVALSVVGGILMGVLIVCTNTKEMKILYVEAPRPAGHHGIQC